MTEEKGPGGPRPEAAPQETSAPQQQPAAPPTPSSAAQGPLKPPPDNEFRGREIVGKRKKSKKQKPVKTQVDEQIDAAIAQSSVQEKKRAQRKAKFYFAIGLGVIALLSYSVHWLMKPYQGGLAFGICKVFLEGVTRYPDHLRLSTVEEFETSVRIWYTQVDSFGEYRMEPIQCYYKNDPERGTLVEKITINRREVDPRLVDNFNRALPSISAFPINMDIPAPLPDSLQDLQIDTQKFRKPIL
ncbi:MAG: hypothetical protein DYH13_03075 [Alphaproteobacteria bacterium PRO2]|nr:hypothetical protein [Alphaproteobacteria bacterium PRO2]